MLRLMVLAICLSILTGCGGSSQSDDTGSSSSAKPKTSSQASADFKEIALGPIDEKVAAHGAEIFDTKCSACHKWEERYVGPQLAGVTKRREPEWIMNMILNPDEMIKQDEQAKALFTEFLTPMTFQNVSEDEAKAILHAER